MSDGINSYSFLSTTGYQRLLPVIRRGCSRGERTTRSNRQPRPTGGGGRRGHTPPRCKLTERWRDVRLKIEPLPLSAASRTRLGGYRGAGADGGVAARAADPPPAGRTGAHVHDFLTVARGGTSSSSAGGTARSHVFPSVFAVQRGAAPHDGERLS